MAKLIVTIGLPASGKTTWAKDYVRTQAAKGHIVKRVNRDELREMVNVGQKFSQKREEFIRRIRNVFIQEALAVGHSVVVDDTNLVPGQIDTLYEIAKQFDAEFVKQDFTNVSLAECIARDKKRANYVGETVIRRMYREHLAPKVKAPVRDENKYDVVVCDLDGTLALLNGRNPYEGAEFCEADELNEPVAAILRQQLDIGHQIIFTSGRKNKFRIQTGRWLASHGFTDRDYKLFMRSDDDNRGDEIVKGEFYETSIKDFCNVMFVLDDRQKVVDMWRSKGLTCLQVAEGDF